MNTKLDLSPLSLLSSSDAGRVADVRLMNGQVLHGKIRSILTKEARLILDLEPGGATVECPFASLRSLSFPFPLKPDDVAAFQKRAKAPVSNVPKKFSITWVDDDNLAGLALNLVADRDGLHLLQVNGNRVRQVFVPMSVVRKYEHDPKIGQALIDDNQVSATVVEGAFQTQRTLRERKIGEYLSDLVAPDELKHALDGQARTPTLRLGELLVCRGDISRKQLNDAMDAQRQNRKKKLGEILVEMGAVTREVINETMAKKLGFPMVKLREVTIDPEVLSLVAVEFARKHSVMPWLLRDGDLVVAFENPMDINVVNMLRFTTGRRIQVTIATQEDIQWAIKTYYEAPVVQDTDLEMALAWIAPTPSQENQGWLEAERPGKEEPIVETASAWIAPTPSQENQGWLEAERLGNEKPIVKFVDNTILDAIRRRASDIQFDPGETQVDLMFRIDGTMVKVRSLKKSLLPGIVSRIKIMCAMDITERGFSQDGGARIVHEGKLVDLRVSVVPTMKGESVVIRILDTKVAQKSIADIGFSQRDERVFSDLLCRGNGIILVTGPRGSGKTTTLYAALGEMIKRNVNVVTVEDPVEYHIPGIKQIQVNTAAGFTFAAALRHILRQDPDVIMIGEIRDQETAKIAIESALTGHLVLSTLQTHGAASAIVRLMETGVESYLLNASVLGVLAQRLVRCNCPKCVGEEKAPPVPEALKVRPDEGWRGAAVRPLVPAVREALKVDPEEVFYRGRGCEQCNQTGYYGRGVVYELLPVTPELRAHIVPGVTAEELHQIAIKEGMVPLTQNALAQARLRKTSLAEVYDIRLE